jgi:hypothetical protein
VDVSSLSNLGGDWLSGSAGPEFLELLNLGEKQRHTHMKTMLFKVETEGGETSTSPRQIPWRAIAAVLGLIILFVLTVVVTGNEKASEFSKGLLQFIFFVAAALLAVDLGRQSLKEGASEVLDAHGRKAVRRIVRLGVAIGGITSAIDTQRQLMRGRSGETGEVAVFEVEGTLDVLEHEVLAQLGIVEDAIEDWRDVVPSEVEAIEQHVERQEPRDD